MNTVFRGCYFLLILAIACDYRPINSYFNSYSKQGRIPVKWTAIEAMTGAMKYSTLSDVYVNAFTCATTAVL